LLGKSCTFSVTSLALFALVYFFRCGIPLLPGLTWDHNPPTSISFIAAIIGMHYHAQLVFCLISKKQCSCICGEEGSSLKWALNIFGRAKKLCNFLCTVKLNLYFNGIYKYFFITERNFIMIKLHLAARHSGSDQEDQIWRMAVGYQPGQIVHETSSPK
jgi:hypothetical protein